MKTNHNIIKAKHEASQLLLANRLDDAWIAYELISRQVPGDYEVWLNLGAIAARQGRGVDAEIAFRRAIELKPDLPQANINMARLLMMKNLFEEALPYLQRYVELQPNAQDGHSQLAILYEKLGNNPAAERSYRNALNLDANNVAVLVGLGRTSLLSGNYNEARKLCERALRLKPDAGEAYVCLISALRRLRCFDEAKHCCGQMIANLPRLRENYLMSMAQICIDQQHYEEAQELYKDLIRISPDLGLGRWNYSLLLLLLGRYQEGWEEYEWRWHTPLFSSTWRNWSSLEKPLWKGESLNGRTILIFSEQGLGDTIQFGRYLQPLVEQGGQVIFHCQKELLGLFRHIPGLQVEERDIIRAHQESFDYYLPLMSLARIMRTTVDTIPTQIPYFQTDPARVVAWRARINRDGFKVGLVWEGSKKNTSDQIRSMKLEEFAPLAEIPGVVLYSLQVDNDAGEMKAFTEKHELIDLAPLLNDFEDTAAAIENLDLVISVDTAVAHLAGALGRPVWTLVYQPTEWRWMLDRDDSPWYPSMRLFRQTLEEPTWPPVIKRVAAALRELVASRGEG